MSATAVRRVVSRLQPGGAPTDAQLVLAIASSSAVAGGGSGEPAGGSPDGREAAFAELVGRYGPMVLGVCRGVLRDAHAAEDAFQAVFLVLARKAGSIRPPGSVGGWLYGVAVRTARKAKTAAARRQRHEMTATTSAKPGLKDGTVGDELDRGELRAIIDAELAALPEMHRAAVVLCDLQSKTRAEAAAELGRAEGTVASWLARGRKALAARLARRGVALPAAGLAAVVTSSAVSAELASRAVGVFAGHPVPESVLVLAEGVMRSLSSASTKLVAGVCAVGVLFAAVATAAAWPAHPVVPPDPPSALPRSETAAPLPKPEPDAKGFLEHGGFVYSVSYAPDGKTFVSVGGGKAVVWDAGTQKKLFSVEGAEFARFTDDGKSFFYLTKDEFHTADPATGKSREKAPRGGPKQVLGYERRWATIAGDGSARVEFDGVRHHVTNYPVKGEAPALADQEAHSALASTAVSDKYGIGGAFAPGGVARFAGTHASTTDYKETECLTVWELPAGARVGTVSPGKRFFDPVQAFAWAPDGKEIAVGYIPGVRVYDAATLKERRAFDKIGDTVAVAYSKDGKTLAVAVREGVTASEDDGFGAASTKEVATVFAVLLLDAATGKQLRRFEGFAENLPVVSLAFSPDGKQLLCGAGFVPGDGPAAGRPQPAKGAKGLRVLNLDEPAKPKGAPAQQDWKEEAVLKDIGGAVHAVAVSPDGKLFAATGTNGMIVVWDANTRKVVGSVNRSVKAANGVSFAPDGKSLAVGSLAGALGYELPDMTLAPWSENHVKFGRPWAVGFSPDGKRIAACDGKRTTVRPLGEEKSRELRCVIEPVDAARPAALAWAPDGKRLAIPFHEPIDDEFAVDVYRTDTWKAKALVGHTGRVTALAWAPDGKVLASGSSGLGADAGDKQNGQLILWDAATNTERHRVAFRGRDGGRTEVFAVAFAPDSATVAVGVHLGSGKSQNRVMLIDVATGKEVGVAFAGIEGEVRSLAFAPDGDRLYGAVGVPGVAEPSAGAVVVWERKP